MLIINLNDNYVHGDTQAETSFPNGVHYKGFPLIIVVGTNCIR